MVEFLKSWVLNIVNIVFLVVLLEVIIPSGRIKKFIHLVSGFILIIAIISPFLNLFNGKIDMKDLEISTRNYIDRKYIENRSKVLQETELKQVSEIYRRKIIAGLEECAGQVEGVTHAKADVIINEDHNSDNYGEILRAYLEIVTDDGGVKAEEVKRIEEIEIDLIKEWEKANDLKSDDNISVDRTDEGDDKIINKVEEKISNMLGIERENVVVCIK